MATSFGMVYLTNSFGNLGLLIVLIPMMLTFIFGISHFEKLEVKAGNYPQKKSSFDVKA